MKTPVALIIFNRPEPTAAVFAEIAKARPSHLFVIADGPRPDRSGEAQLCDAARAITEGIDWPCEVRRNYAEGNLGCRERVVTGISWLFDHVEEAIILEDDCVPRLSFFRFCEEMLTRYRGEDRVMMVGGRYSQYQAADLSREFPASYDFVCQGTCWGWGTWKRAWMHYDQRVGGWPELRDSAWFSELFPDEHVRASNRQTLEETYAAGGEIGTWDYQWEFSIWARQGLAIVPRFHLVSNVGFGVDATHTRSASNNRGKPLEEDLEFPLSHPPGVRRNLDLDRLIAVSDRPSQPERLHLRVLRRLRKEFSRLYGRPSVLRNRG